MTIRVFVTCGWERNTKNVRKTLHESIISKIEHFIIMKLTLSQIGRTGTEYYTPNDTIIAGVCSQIEHT